MRRPPNYKTETQPVRRMPLLAHAADAALGALNYNTADKRLRRLQAQTALGPNRVDYKIFRPPRSPGSRRGASATVGGAQDRGASWGDGAAAAVKPLSPPGGEQLVVAGVLKCAS